MVGSIPTSIHRELYHMQDVDNTDDYSVNMSDPNTTAPEDEYPDARDFTTADAGDQQTVIAMVILFVIFCICGIMLKISLLRGNVERSRVLERQQEREKKRTLETQRKIEKNIIIKTLGETDTSDSNSTTDVETGNGNDRSTGEPSVYRKDRSETQVCIICLCEYSVGDRICFSRNHECPHHFHTDCGIAWLAKNSECPMCRADYLLLDPSVSGDKNVQHIVQPDATEAECYHESTSSSISEAVEEGAISNEEDEENPGEGAVR